MGTEKEFLKGVACPLCAGKVYKAFGWYKCENLKWDKASNSKSGCPFELNEKPYGKKTPLSEKELKDLTCGKKVEAQFHSKKSDKDYKAFVYLEGGETKLEFKK